MDNLLHRWIISIAMVIPFAVFTPNCVTIGLYSPRKLRFAEETWILPITVEQAATKFKLKFFPPNLFSTAIQHNGRMHIEFPFYNNDDSFFRSTNTDSSKFRSRIVHTYCFYYPDTLNCYDSLKTALQASVSEPFTIHQDTMRFAANTRKIMFSKGLVNYEIAHRSDNAYVAIRHQPRLSIRYPARVQVFFFFGLPYEDLYTRLTMF